MSCVQNPSQRENVSMSIMSLTSTSKTSGIIMLIDWLLDFSLHVYVNGISFTFRDLYISGLITFVHIIYRSSYDTVMIYM